MLQVNVVCIAKDQAEHSSTMLAALTSFGRKIRVIDRTPNDLGDGWDVIRNVTGHGRLTGKMRELGLSIARHGAQGILFIDGDRIPNCDFMEAIRGRESEVILFYAEQDNRDVVHEFTDVTKACTQLENSPFYSNAVYVPTSEINRCLELNGSCFDPRFDGNWGEEDRHFGDRLFWQGAKITLAPYRFHTSGEIRDRYADGVNPINVIIRRQLCAEMVSRGRPQQKDQNAKAHH